MQAVLVPLGILQTPIHESEPFYTAKLYDQAMILLPTIYLGSNILRQQHT